MMAAIQLVLTSTVVAATLPAEVQIYSRLAVQAPTKYELAINLKAAKLHRSHCTAIVARRAPMK